MYTHIFQPYLPPSRTRHACPPAWPALLVHKYNDNNNNNNNNVATTTTTNHNNTTNNTHNNNHHQHINNKPACVAGRRAGAAASLRRARGALRGARPSPPTKSFPTKSPRVEL